MNVSLHINKKLRKIFFFSLAIFFSVSSVWAHPLDISISTASFAGEKMNITTYFHSYEIDYLLQKNISEKKIFTVDEYFLNGKIIEDYVAKNTSLTNNSQKCHIENISVIKDEAYVVLSDGLGVSYSFVCASPIENIELYFGYFFEFPLQTNRITLYDMNAGISSAKPVFYKVLTSKIPSVTRDLMSVENLETLDSDTDGLSDENEKIYGTSANNADTDGDNFSDSEEIDYGWDPINPEMGPGQLPRERFDLQVSQEQRDLLSEIEGNVKNENLSDFSGNASGHLKKTMKYLNDFFEKRQGNILGVFILVFILGIIHTLGPGHSKGLLISYTLEEHNGYLKGFLFASIFSITHILDIVILFLISQGVSLFFQENYTYYVQVISSILLFFFGIYLLVRSLKKKKEQKKSTLGIAFLAGIVPCSFAWSIFLLLYALGKTAWILPLIGALGLGIYVTLCMIVILTVFLKNKMYSKVKNLGKYSSLISAIMIFLISIFMLVNVFVR